jgi:ubiquinone/menaquinone biosynthesis C-methylase UbiE
VDYRAMSLWQSNDMMEAWIRAAAQRNQMMAAATERMFALAKIGPGARVLDVGAGVGDTAIMLAQQVGPTGSVVAIDAAAPMVAATTDAARAAGLPNVSAAVMNAAELGHDLGAFGAAVARNVLMFLDDPGRAIAGVCKVLEPGGRFAAITWAELDRNPFNDIVIGTVRRAGKVPRPTPEVVRAFSLSDPAALTRIFESAGLREVVCERVTATREFAALDDAMKVVRETPLYRELTSALSDHERGEALEAVEQAYAAYVGDGGRCVFPIESLVAAGAAP